MQAKRQPRRFFALRGFSPHTRPIGSFLLTLDAVRTSLELVKDSADVCPPLKSAAGAVVAVCNLADRVAASDTNAETLAWRAVTILDTIYNSVDATDPNAKVPPQLLHHLLQFEQLLTEICTAMKNITKKGRLHRAFHLRRNESQLAKFTARLDSTAQIFTIATMSSQTASLGRIEDAVEKVSSVSSALEQSNIHLRGQVRCLQLTVVFLA
ncbi:hypothetical protein C8R44DRAFT_823015 [Mycena epipterygia]|nr:hypothetical protein C8R44DRAFT_823015 [Mycena epipterygia]